jgi:hypothetical protein
MIRLAIVLFLTAVHSLAQVSLAGAAKIDITPPVGHQLWGLHHRVGPSTGKLDPLFARALVLRSAQTSLAMVSLDLGRTFNEDLLNEVRARVRKEANVEHLIVAASHTHNAPTALSRQYLEGKPDRWEWKLMDDIVRVVAEANKKAVPSRIAAGKGASYIGYNRQDPLLNGKWIPRNEARVQTSPMDPIVQVLRVESMTGTPLAVLVNYAAHPVVLDSANSTEYSADYPGAMAEYVERTVPGNPVTLFVQGACGEINTVHVGQYSSTEKGPGGYGVLVTQMRELGRELGAEVTRVVNRTRPDAADGLELQVRTDRLRFRTRWDMATIKQMQAVPTYYQWAVEGRPIGYPADEHTLEITTVIINRSIAILTMPGEPYVEHQIAFRDRLPGVDTILAAYSNGYFSYFPTIRAATRQGTVYGANAWPTILEVGAGERMVDHGVIAVLEMIGRLKDRPDPPAGW